MAPRRPGASVAVDVVALGLVEGDLHVLLAERAEPPYQGFWTLLGELKQPGTPLDIQARVLVEQPAAGNVRFLEQLKTFDRPEQREGSGAVIVPGRDPRGDVVSVAYLALLAPHAGGPQRLIGDQPASWHRVRNLPENVGFDHRTIIDYAVRRLRGKIRYSSIAFALLRDEFTLPELHRIYEQILGRTLHRANFQRDLLRADVVEPVGERQGSRGRPAHLYRFRHRSFGLLEEPEGFD